MCLEWHDDVGRWYCAGTPIHAGAAMQIASKGDPPGPWIDVRIESDDRGRKLYAHMRSGSLEFRTLIANATGGPLGDAPAWSRAWARWPEPLPRVPSTDTLLALLRRARPLIASHRRDPLEAAVVSRLLPAIDAELESEV